VIPKPAVLVVGALLVAALLAHSAYYHPFISDDALISLRYAKRWMNGDGLTWTDGERVEGYTNFLWVVLTALLGKLGGYVFGARLLGTIGVLLAVFAAGFVPEKRRFSVPSALVGGGLLVTSAPLAIWAIGGLEQGLIAGLLAVVLRALATLEAGADWRRLMPAGLACAALVLVRADGFVLVGLALFGHALASRAVRDGIVCSAKLALPTLIALALQLAFRLAYYGDFQPNTARVKLALTTARVSEGFTYVTRGEGAAAVVLAAGVAATVFAVRRGAGRTLFIPWSIVLGWWAYVAIVGGDIFPGFRQLVPTFVPLCLLAGDEARAAWPRFERRKALGGAALAAVLAANAKLQFSHPENHRAKEERWEWDGYSMGRTLRRAFGKQQPLHAVDAAGALPFWSELPSLDMLGLNDRHIARTRVAGFGTGSLGHELGDGAYVLARKPDLISFNLPAGQRVPELLSGQELVKLPEFHAKYQWIRVATEIGNRSVGEIWVRREGGKLGVVRGSDRIEIPGYFLTGQESNASARLGEADRLVADLDTTTAGVLPALEVPAGRWQVEISPAPAQFVADFRCRGVSMTPSGSSHGGAGVLELAGSTPLALALAPEAHGVVMRVATVVLSRTSAPATLACARDDEPLALTRAQLPREPIPGALPAHPRYRAFGERGVVLDLGTRGADTKLEVGLSDGNYRLQLFQGDTLVATKRLKRGRPAREVAEQRFALDRLDAERALRLSITPDRGAKDAGGPESHAILYARSGS
jgi:arabinofuranosyltransferase